MKVKKAQWPLLKFPSVYSGSLSGAPPDIIFCQIVCFSEVARRGRLKKKKKNQQHQQLQKLLQQPEHKEFEF